MSKREQEKVAEQTTKNVEVTAELSENFTTHNYKLSAKKLFIYNQVASIDKKSSDRTRYEKIVYCINYNSIIVTIGFVISGIANATVSGKH